MSTKLLSQEVEGFLGNSSMIRRMFEAGIELRKKYGADHVFDFSLGNPDLPPPPEVKQAMLEIAQKADQPFSLGYMPNAGSPAARAALAKLVSADQQMDVPASHVIATCGAAGGLNAFFRAVLTPGDEVLCPAPYFVEYGFYTGNYGGKLRPVPAKKDFSLDLEAMEKALTPKARAVILNSPNNPTGTIYTRAELTAFSAILAKKSAEYGRPIYLIADEPYRFLNFDGVEIPSVFSLYEYSVVIGSFSKSLSLAGERLGYVAVSPRLAGAEELVAGVILTNRILGYVNAPVIAQKIAESCAMCQVDLDIYRRRRDAMAKVLDGAGIRYQLPRGAFYFFPESPVADDKAFVQTLLGECILGVPGSGFGLAGHFRLAFCVDEKVILGSADGFKRAMEKSR